MSAESTEHAFWARRSKPHVPELLNQLDSDDSDTDVLLVELAGLRTGPRVPRWAADLVARLLPIAARTRDPRRRAAVVSLLGAYTGVWETQRSEAVSRGLDRVLVAGTEHLRVLLGDPGVSAPTVTALVSLASPSAIPLLRRALLDRYRSAEDPQELAMLLLALTWTESDRWADSHLRTEHPPGVRGAALWHFTHSVLPWREEGGSLWTPRAVAVLTDCWGSGLPFTPPPPWNAEYVLFDLLRTYDGPPEHRDLIIDALLDQKGSAPSGSLNVALNLGEGSLADRRFTAPLLVRALDRPELADLALSGVAQVPEAAALAADHLAGIASRPPKGYVTPRGEEDPGGEVRRFWLAVRALLLAEDPRGVDTVVTALGEGVPPVLPDLFVDGVPWRADRDGAGMARMGGHTKGTA